MDLSGGCDGCAAPPTVETILLSLEGNDVLLDWSADPVSSPRFKIYTLEGADFSQQSLLGTSTTRTFRHREGATYGSLTSYRVSAVDECGQEGPL